MNTKMDKNIVALLTPHYTIGAELLRINTIGGLLSGSKPQTDVFTLLSRDILELGDLIVANARGIPEVLQVVRVDEESCIEIGESIAYDWVIQKIDLSAYSDSKSKEARIKDKIRSKLRAQAIQQVRMSYLGGDLEDSLQSINKILADES